ncbi:MAG: hypothetical protein ACWA5R_12365 [bacterium]
MATKQELIQEMIRMQKMFQEYEHKNGVQPEEYYMAQEGHPLHNYKEKYDAISMQVLNMAHEECGSSY